MRALAPVMLLCLLHAGPAAAAGGAELTAFLHAVGEQERARGSVSCRYTEHQTIEELDPDGKVEGRLIRVYRVEQHGYEVPRRTLLEEKSEGEELTAALRREHKPDPKQPARERMGPFHPELQPLYAFELVAKAPPAAAELELSPREPHERRMKGTARVDLAGARIVSMHLQPSKAVRLVDELEVRLDLTQTACGNVPTRIRTRGSGGLLLFKVRFQYDLRTSGHERLDQ